MIPTRNKYRAKPTIYNGVRYASRAEAKRAAELDLLVKAGHIRFWVGQPVFRLGCPENKYVADFLVVGLDSTWVEDTKGVWTPKFRRDVRLWQAYGPCNLAVLSRNTSEVIKGGGER